MMMRRLMKSRAQMLATRSNATDPKNFVPYESTRIATLDRFADEPEPTNDEMIVTHYLKHHP